MPATATRNQGKTLFVKETLIDHPTANPKFVNEAWKAAGMEGTMSETLVNKMRSQLKLTGNLRGTRSSRKGKPSASKATTSGKTAGGERKNGRVGRPPGVNRRGPSAPAGRGVRLTELEAELDRLLFSVMSLGDLPEVEKALRQTRRALYQCIRHESVRSRTIGHSNGSALPRRESTPGVFLWPCEATVRGGQAENSWHRGENEAFDGERGEGPEKSAPSDPEDRLRARDGPSRRWSDDRIDLRAHDPRR